MRNVVFPATYKGGRRVSPGIRCPPPPLSLLSDRYLLRRKNSRVTVLLPGIGSPLPPSTLPFSPHCFCSSRLSSVPAPSARCALLPTSSSLKAALSILGPLSPHPAFLSPNGLGPQNKARAPWVFLTPVCVMGEPESRRLCSEYQRGGWLCLQGQEGRAGGALEGTEGPDSLGDWRSGSSEKLKPGGHPGSA